jgi:2-dehydropantoate 2-reductase
MATKKITAVCTAAVGGYAGAQGEEVGLAARANERIVDLVKRVERGELKQDPSHITDLRLN